MKRTQKTDTRRVRIETSTGKGATLQTSTQEVELPRTLAAAVTLFDEAYVLRCFIGYHVILFQEKERTRLRRLARAANPKPSARKRGRYLDALGL